VRLDTSLDPAATTAWTFSTASGTTGAWATDDTVSDTHFLQVASGHAVQTTAGAITITSSWVRSGAAYGVARHIYIPIVKRAVVDFAVGADWTPRPAT
jgi:hypothetical protein